MTTRVGLIGIGVLAAVFVLQRLRRRKEVSSRAGPTDVSSHRILGYVEADSR
jgi:hypothetical protein